MLPRTTGLWWLLLLLVHGATATFFGANAAFYIWFEDTGIEYTLQSFHLGVEFRWHRTVGAIFGLGALPHAVLSLQMVSAALVTRSFAFTLSLGDARRHLNFFSRLRCSRLFVYLRFSLSRKVKAVSELAPAWHCSLPPSAWTGSVRRAIFGRAGLLGTDGRYFLRELVELSLQTVQAYRMSCYLPRVLPNRFYVGLLVTNCWITPIIYAVTKKNETTRRLLMRLACDCALDFATSVVIPCVILARYAGEFDFELQSFNYGVWFDKIWVANFVYELQIVLVVSWQDLLMRLVFSFGMLHSMDSIKALVGIGAEKATSSNQVSPHSTMVGSAASIIPAAEANVHSTKRRNNDHPQPLPDASKQVPAVDPVAIKRGGCASKAVHTALFIWGAAILGLHFAAEVHLGLPQCAFQVRPWGKAKATCAIVDLNCYTLGITGSASELETTWGRLDVHVIDDLLVRHCSALEMPSMLQESSLLKTIKLYNTTIAVWGSEAAITATDHPFLLTMYFVRINMPNGELPPGLLSTDFPRHVDSIMFCSTNLRSLPADLDTKWPSLGDLFLELSGFEEVPVAATRIQSKRLSLHGNPIRKLPGELFEMESVEMLYIGSTPIATLPTHVAAVSSSIGAIYMTNTQVAYFPEWVDTLVSRWSSEGTWRPLSAGDTPYCDQLPSILDGSQLEFALTNADELGEIATPPSVLMNTSLANQDVLSRIVSCMPFTAPWYWIDGDDAVYGLDYRPETEGSMDSSISILPVG